MYKMRGKDKIEDQLINELAKMCQRIIEPEAVEVMRRLVEEASS